MDLGLAVDAKSVSRRCVDRQLLARCLSKERAERPLARYFVSDAFRVFCSLPVHSLSIVFWETVGQVTIDD